MTQARRTQIDPSVTPYYHCINRCVRRAFLCGEDYLTGKNYDYRKQWFIDKLKLLGDVFAIDICAYAVMSNHYHLVLRINKEKAAKWKEREVAERWKQLYKGNILVNRWFDGGELRQAEYMAVSEILAKWRNRLTDISWFMRVLNESIAREANKEDNCKGSFWEGRFKSQALLDEGAVLSCMMYVDLNPVRAKMTDNLMDSDFTSIQQRLKAFANRKPGRPKKESNKPTLLGFKKTFHAKISSKPEIKKQQEIPSIPIAMDDYFELIDWTGRAIKKNKRGNIPSHILPLLQQIGIKPDKWLDNVSHFESKFPVIMGKYERVKKAAKKFRKKWYHGVKPIKESYI